MGLAFVPLIGLGRVEDPGASEEQGAPAGIWVQCVGSRWLTGA